MAFPEFARQQRVAWRRAAAIPARVIAQTLSSTTGDDKQA
jgi:hypothetical protein